MAQKDDRSINSVYDIPGGLLPLGSSDWEVITIERGNNVEEIRKVNSGPHQTRQLLVSTLNKPISQLSTLDE